MAKFYEKIGNNLFAPKIEVTNILLDNTFISSSTGTQETNGIVIDLSVSSKENSFDQFITDVEYLQYSAIVFAVFQDDTQLNNFISNVSSSLSGNKTFENTIVELASNTEDVLQQFVVLNSFVNTADITERDQNYTAKYTTTFSNLNTDNITLCVIPYVSFNQYFDDNGIDAEAARNIFNNSILSKTFEVHRFNILKNKRTINDQVSINLLNDVRQINELKRNTLTNFPEIQFPVGIEKGKNSYISEIFTSFDYQNEKVKNYFFADINAFLSENVALYKTINATNINDILYNNNCAVFTIKRIEPNRETLVCSFNASFQNIRTNNINVQFINDLSNSRSICILFEDDLSLLRETNFYYHITIDCLDAYAVVKDYYNVSNSTNSGSYFDLLTEKTNVETIANNPDISDENGKFYKNQAILGNFYLSTSNFVNNFFEIYNLFIDTTQNNVMTINQNKINSIINTLVKSDVIVYNTFLAYVTNCLYQIGNYFESIGNSTNSCSKTSNIINTNNIPFYFKRSDDNSKIQYFCEYETNNSRTQYDLTLELDSTNEVSYKILNSVLNLTNKQVTYSSEYSLIDSYLEQNGTIVVKTSSATKTKPKASSTNSINRTSINSIFQVDSQSTTLDVKRQLEASSEQQDSNKISNIIGLIDATNQLDFFNMYKFQLAYLDDMSSKFLIPEANIMIYENKTKQWKKETEVTGYNRYYLAKTVYNKTNNIFNSSKIQPVINEEYFLYFKSSKATTQTQNVNNFVKNGNR